MQKELQIQPLGETRTLVSGSVRLDDLSDYLGCDVTEDGVETIGGLVVEQLGHVPHPGVCVFWKHWKITVRQATQKRVKKVLMEKEVINSELVGPLTQDLV